MTIKVFGFYLASIAQKLINHRANIYERAPCRLTVFFQCDLCTFLAEIKLCAIYFVEFYSFSQKGGDTK